MFFVNSVYDLYTDVNARGWQIGGFAGAGFAP